MRTRANVLPIFCLVFFSALLSALPAQSQTNSNAATVTLNATLAESLSVSATVNTVNFTLVPGGVAAGSAQVPITTAWVLSPTRSTVVLYGFFASSTVALTDGSSDNIPSTDVLGEVTTGAPTSFTPFSSTVPLGGSSAGLELFSQAITSSNVASDRTDNLSLEIDLTSTPQLPAGSYTGTLTLQAQAQ